MEVRGVPKIRAALQKLKKKKHEGVERGLKKAGLFLLRESQRIVPIDTAALKNSGRVRSEGKGLATEVIVGYAQSYALYVHENLDAQHAPGKSAKYLERPLKQNMNELRKIVIEEAKK